MNRQQLPPMLATPIANPPLARAFFWTIAAGLCTSVLRRLSLDAQGSTIIPYLAAPITYSVVFALEYISIKKPRLSDTGANVALLSFAMGCVAAGFAYLGNNLVMGSGLMFSALTLLCLTGKLLQPKRNPAPLNLGSFLVLIVNGAVIGYFWTVGITAGSISTLFLGSVGVAVAYFLNRPGQASDTPVAVSELTTK